MNWNYLILFSIIIFGITSAVFAIFDGSTSLPPNIIVIMTDDLNLKTTEFLLSNNLMPHLQNKIIDQGITFSNSFVTNPTCCPSRSTFLTGQYSHNHDVLTNTMRKSLDDDSTIAVWLQKQGYRTGYVGKYLNGYDVDSTVPPGWDDWQALVDPSTYRMYNYTFNDNGQLVTYDPEILEYQTDTITKRVTNFIKESREYPIFLVISTLAPHSESPSQNTKACVLSDDRILRSLRPHPDYKHSVNNLQISVAPSFNESDISDKPSSLQKRPMFNDKNIKCIKKLIYARAESMRSVDDLIDYVFQTLSANNQLENSIIIFTSDNGILLGEHRIAFEKHYPYEESIRVPLYIRDPYSSGINSSSFLVTNNDLAPTIMEYANANADIEMDGMSLVKLIREPENKNWRSGFLIEHWETTTVPTYFALRTDTKLYVEYENEFEFYDLENDPYQLENIHECNSESCKNEINSLKSWLTELKQCNNGTCQQLEIRR